MRCLFKAAERGVNAVKLSVVDRVRRVVAMVREANTFQRALARHAMVRTCLLCRIRGFRRSRPYTGVGCGCAISRCRAGVRSASPTHTNLRKARLTRPTTTRGRQLT